MIRIAGGTGSDTVSSHTHILSGGHSEACARERELDGGTHEGKDWHIAFLYTSTRHYWIGIGLADGVS